MVRFRGRAVIAAHGGLVRIESCKGAGTTISVWLPNRTGGCRDGGAPDRDQSIVDGGPARSPSSGYARQAKAAGEGLGFHEDTLKHPGPLVLIVDDDESVRESLVGMLTQLGFTAHAFSSAEEFLASDRVGQADCLILDVAMPGMSGPDLQRTLTLRGHDVPIVFITAHGDASAAARLLAQGAVDCLFKPFSDTALLDAIHEALRRVG